MKVEYHIISDGDEKKGPLRLLPPGITISFNARTKVDTILAAIANLWEPQFINAQKILLLIDDVDVGLYTVFVEGLVPRYFFLPQMRKLR